MAAHLYWRLNITASIDTTFMHIAEFQIRATAGGANQATGGTASASSIADAARSADKAFDGNSATHWQSSSFPSYPQWLRYQFASAVSCGQIAVTAHASTGGAMIKTFDVQWSDDGTTWTTEWTVSNQTGWAAGETRTFSPPGHLHWRLWITEANNTGAIDIGELQMRASAGGANLCSGGTASATNSLGGNLPAAAFDGSTATSWQTTFSPTLPVFLRYSFAGAVEVVQVAVTGSNAYAAYIPKAFDVQWSDDGTSWTTAFSASGAAPLTAGATILATQGGPVPVRVTAQSLEVLAVSAASVRVTAQSLEALIGTYQVRMPKAYAFAVIGPNPAAVALSKAMAYAVLHDTAIGPIPDTPSATRRRPVVAFLG